jgi:DHA1 family multidrug resistance protein-like MFS transporter
VRRARGSWQWLLAIFTLASVLEVVFFGQLSAFLPLYLPRLGVSEADVPAWLARILALAGLVGLLFLPFWGALADRYSRKPVIVRSFVVHLVAGSVMALAPNVWVFGLGYVLTALAFGNTGLMTATLAERTPVGRTAFAITTMNSAGPIGAFVGPLVGGPVYDRFGLPALLLIDVGVMLAVIALLALGYDDRYEPRRDRTLLAMALEGPALLVRSRRLRVLFPALFVVIAGWMAVFAFMPLAVTALYRGDAPGTAVGLVSGAAGLAALAAGPVVGGLADRVGQWRVLFASLAATALLFPLPALAPDLLTFGILWTVVTGIRSGSFGLSFAIMAASADVAHRGRVMSFAYLPLNVGVVVGSALGGLAASANVFLVFPLAAALTLAGLPLLRIAQGQPVLRANE